MRIFYFDPDDKRRQVQTVYLENILNDVEVEVASQLSGPLGACEKIDHNAPFDLILVVAPPSIPVYELFDRSVQKDARAAFILMSENPLNAFAGMEGFKSQNPKNDFIQLPITPADFRETMLKSLSPSYGQRVIPAFQKVRLIHFLRFSKAHCNVYVKLSNHKYVKIINAGSTYDHSDIEKYREKKVSHFYIRNDDFEHFQVTIHKTPFLTFQNEKMSEADLQKCLRNTHAILKEMILEIGITREIADLAEKSVDEIVNLAYQQQDLNVLLKNMQQRLDYIYDHSFLTSIVCCEILKHMHWNTEDKVKKLVMAAMLHDLKLNDPELCKIEISHDPRLQTYSPQEKKAFLGHPMETSLLLTGIDFISPEVASIVLQHHETPEGNGFPNGLHHSKLSLLSCIFIVAHTFVQNNLEIDFDPDRQDKIFEDLAKRFSLGSFKSVLDAFSNLHPNSTKPA
ncbi:MAG: HD domain-containing protein [Bdellovibrio sp.]|nr:HD domain-containing protein [Bdellovibrio sp.]